jgi:membrane associated rhomboid family serine protease
MTFGPTSGPASDQADAGPVCPRHPGTVSYVRCQRCERPVCPACQRPAAVGIQCVDCVKEGARTVRTARTVFGGRAGGSRPVITQSIIGLCVVVYVFQWMDRRVTAELSFLPYQALAQPYRFLTSAFLHSPSFLLHIVLNMYALWLLGPYLEQLLGRLRFAALYLISAFGGSVGYFVLAAPSAEPGSAWLNGALGASGAVFGLFSAVVVINRRLGRDSSGVIGVIAINLVLGFWSGLNIAWQAHLGGLITGAVVSLALAAPVSAASGAAFGTASAAGAVARRTQRQVAGLVGITALLLVLTVVKFLAVPAGLLA